MRNDDLSTDFKVLGTFQSQKAFSLHLRKKKVFMCMQRFLLKDFPSPLLASFIVFIAICQLTAHMSVLISVAFVIYYVYFYKISICQFCINKDPDFKQHW